MADYWRGECSARMLAALLRGLPDNSALHRAMNQGRTWGTSHVLIWQLIYQMQRLETLLGAQGVQKQPKMPKKRKTPWDDESNTVRIGQVNKGDEVAAIEYLQALGGS